MKRSFSDIDSIFPTSLDTTPSQNIISTLHRINTVESTIESKLQFIRRIDHLNSVNPNINVKILRNYIRHEYYAPSDQDDKGYYLLYVEGNILDRCLHSNNSSHDKNSFVSIPNNIKYGTFWEKIRVQIDKKGIGVNSSQMGVMVEWSLMDNSQIGMSADCFRFRIPNIWGSKASAAEKQIGVKITFHRSNDILPRYELSPLLKKIFPFMRIDPTETDIMTAMWEYIRFYNLMDRRLIKCNEDLKPILGGETIMLNNLRGKVMEHVFPSKPIVVDYSISQTNSNIPIKNAKHTPAYYSKYNAKAFDIEVDIEDQYAYRRMSLINSLVKKQNQVEDELMYKYNRSVYIMKSILKTQARLSAINNDLIISEALLKNPSMISERTLNQEKSNQIMESGYDEEILKLLGVPSSLIDLIDPIQPIRTRGVIDYGIDSEKISEGRKTIKLQIDRERQALIQQQQAGVSDMTVRQHLYSSTAVISSSSSPSSSSSSSSSSSIAEAKEDNRMDIDDNSNDDVISQSHQKMDVTNSTNNNNSSSNDKTNMANSTIHESTKLIEQKMMTNMDSDHIERPIQLTAMHGLRGFMDVGDDMLFRSSWVKDTAKLFIQSKQ